MQSKSWWWTREFELWLMIICGVAIAVVVQVQAIRYIVPNDKPAIILDTSNLARFDLTMIAGYGWTSIAEWDRHTGQAWVFDKEQLRWVALPPLPQAEIK